MRLRSIHAVSLALLLGTTALHPALADSYSPGSGSGSGGGTPGGSSGQVQVNNAGAFAGVTISGDGTISGSGVLAVTKTGGVSFGALATVTPGTGIATALGIAIGSAGAPVVLGGAGGTPSGLTLTNASGLPTTGLTGALQAAQEPAHTGDMTNTAGSLATTVTKTNGVSFGALATVTAGTNVATAAALALNGTGALVGTSGASLTAATLNGLTGTALSSGFSIAGGTSSKTLTMSNTMALQATDGSTVNFGAGGTFQPASALTDNYNNSGTVFCSLCLTISNTSWATGTRLFKLLYNSASVFDVDPIGLVTISNSNSGTVDIKNGTQGLVFSGSYFGASRIGGMANNGSTDNTGVYLGFVTNPQTANATISRSQNSFTWWNNAGASGEVDLTLPTAPAKGATYCFAVVAAQTLKIIAEASTVIYSGATVTSAAGNFASSTVGSHMCIYNVNSTTWMSYSTLGTWTAS